MGHPGGVAQSHPFDITHSLRDLTAALSQDFLHCEFANACNRKSLYYNGIAEIPPSDLVNKLTIGPFECRKILHSKKVKWGVGPGKLQP